MKRYLLPLEDTESELRALKLTLIPHPDNNDARKLVTLMLVASWCAITVGISFGWAVPSEMYGLLSAFVGAWVTKIQERELGRLTDAEDSEN